MQPENYIYFFTVCGFFIGFIFSFLGFSQPEDMLLYTLEITLFFYLFIHVVIMNFVDIKRFGKSLFKKDEYEEVSEFFIKELDIREKRMDSLLLEIDKNNQEHNNSKKEGKENKKAA